MSNSPLKPLQTREVPVVKAAEPAILPADVEKSESTAVNNEAASISVPRTQAKNAATSDPAGPLNSLLQGLRKGGDVSAAHGGLDASRVFGLLDDDDES